jgi:DNA invertase Pin-like site-specific DNA recombinase
MCRLHRATLLIAKLDRLSRDAHFLLGLEKAGIDFIAVDMPNANRLTVGIMALVAQQEREAISTRTKAALAAAKARGTRLGNPENLHSRAKGTQVSVLVRRTNSLARAQDLAPILAEITGDLRKSLSDIANALNARHIPAPRGGDWKAVQVQRIIKLLEMSNAAA